MKGYDAWVYLAFVFAAVAWADSSNAQVSQTVVIGVTPTCPYGIVACASGAREGLSELEGVESVAPTPDSYNCTFEVDLKDSTLPPLDRWPAQFKGVVGEIFLFRGVELTVDGHLVARKGRLELTAEGIDQPIRLASLEHKLQWNFKKRAAREPEPAERQAYHQLTTRMRTAKTKSFKVQITGPLQLSQPAPVLEVREYFMLND